MVLVMRDGLPCRLIGCNPPWQCPAAAGLLRHPADGKATVIGHDVARSHGLDELRRGGDAYNDQLLLAAIQRGAKLGARQDVMSFRLSALLAVTTPLARKRAAKVGAAGTMLGLRDRENLVAGACSHHYRTLLHLP